MTKCSEMGITMKMMNVGISAYQTNTSNGQMMRRQRDSALFSNSGVRSTPRTFSDQAGNSAMSYSESLATQRQQTRNTSLNLKKLKYHFKNISAKILRSKTSAAAKQVVGQARREVLRLKRQKQSGNYNSKEIDAAIEHAKAMERVAKKKAKHLEEEERVKCYGGPCADNMITEEEWLQKTDGEQISEAGGEVVSGIDGEASSGISGEWTSASEIDEEWISAADARWALEIEKLMDESSEFLKDISRDMEMDVMDELSDLMPVADENMDPKDLKLLKIKHRSKEMSDIAKADAKYLKAIFSDNANTTGATGSSPVVSGAGVAVGPTINIVL